MVTKTCYQQPCYFPWEKAAYTTLRLEASTLTFGQISHPKPLKGLARQDAFECAKLLLKHLSHVTYKCSQEVYSSDK